MVTRRTACHRGDSDRLARRLLPDRLVDPTVEPRDSRRCQSSVLGPPTQDGRLGTGLTLINQGYAGNLVISLNSPEQREARQVVQAPPAGVVGYLLHP